MEYGHLPEEELTSVDYTLSPDSPFTKATLEMAGPVTDFKVHVGLGKWGRREWLGSFFPMHTKEQDFLDEYVKHFDCIELNATFYQVYGPETILNWKDKAKSNPGFIFCPKFSQSITHLWRLKNVDELTARYFEGIAAFGDQLGPAFIQLGENYTYKNFEDLKAYLKTLPKGYTVFLEVRHKDWFGVPENRNMLFQTMGEYHVGTVITDSSGRRDCVHMELTIPQVMLRFVGSGNEEIDDFRINSWVDRLTLWKLQGLQQVWLFVHAHDESKTPALAARFIDHLNTGLDANIKPLKFLR